MNGTQKKQHMKSLLTPHDFTKEVRNILYDLQAYRVKHPEEFIFSDIIDEKGNQYVNLVQEGGGILGIALVGFTYVLEKMGLRFLSLGGTSAGSINAMLLAAILSPEQEKSEKILQILTSENFNRFVDGGILARMLHRAIVQNESPFILIPIFVANWIRMAVSSKIGLNPGKEFEKWLSNHVPQRTVKDLLDNMNTFGHPMYLRDSRTMQRKPITDKSLIEAELSIIAADITTETKVDFPRMADLYFENPQNESPVQFVRASMSVPGVFEPVKIDISSVQQNEEERLRIWRERTSYVGKEMPKEVLLVDGGVMSNFPIDTFHNDDDMPNRPTIGVKLGLDRNHYNKIDRMSKLLTTCFNAASSIRDFEFLNKHEYYRDSVAYIDVEGVNWLDFNLPDEDKIKLFVNGAKAAERFLRDFDWVRFKRNRQQKLIQRNKAIVWRGWDDNSVIYRIGLNENHHEEREISKFYRERLQSKNKLTLLWIDDNPDNDAGVIHLLEKLNFNVLTAETSEAALNTLLNFKGKISFIVSDNSRNGNPMEGLDFCWRLYLHDNRRLQKYPVILRSGSQLQALNSKARDNGKQAFQQSLPPNIVRMQHRNPLIVRDLMMEIFHLLHPGKPLMPAPALNGKKKRLQLEETYESRGGRE